VPYATLNDLVDRAGDAEILQVADRDGDDVADAPVIAAALDTTDHSINGYLAVRYAMPLTAVPPIVVGWAVSIARYLLHRDGAPEHVVRDYKQALVELEKAGAGKIDVPGADGVTPEQSPEGRTIADGTPPVFTRENLEDWL
jgi:phage gp36-like protein